MYCGDFYSCYQYPDNIHDEVQAATLAFTWNNIFAERHQRYHGELKCLDAEWDADDCEKQYDAAQEIQKKNDKTSKNDPDNITECIHITKMVINS